MKLQHIFLACAIACLATAVTVASADKVAPTILSLDFGNEWLKGCLANQKSSTIGTHLDVVINEQSNRKTPNVLGFDNDDDRILGDSALPLLFRNPSKVFPHVKRLIGKTLDDEATKRYLADFPALELKADAERKTVVFGKKGGDLSVEEIVVMLLQLAKRQSENHVKANAEPADIGPVTDIVLTVPEHFTAAQRTLFQQLVELAGFSTPKSTLNELTAVAVDYAVRNLQEGKKKIAFLGSGTMTVSANLVELEKDADGSISVKVLRTASDESVGGYSFDVVLRDALAKKFDSTHQKGGASITTNARAMAKLLRESREIKEMLSVSPIIESNMEELFNGKDYKASATQDEFVAWTAELANKLFAPLRTVLQDVEGVDGIELFGGAIRIPSVQNAIKAAFPEIPLGKHVDGEEGALLGAAHYAGVLTNISKLTKVTVDETAVIKAKTAADETLILNEKQQKALADKIAALDEKAAQRAAADAARNGLESLLNDARDLLSKGAPKGKKEQAATLESQISESSNFVDDSDKKTTADAFNEVREKLLVAMKPLQEPKKVEKEAPKKAESKPKKKRDRRAEHAKAQKEYENAKKRDIEQKKKQDEKRKAEAAAKKAKKDAPKKKEAPKKETKKEAPKKEAPKKDAKKDSKDAKKDTKKKSSNKDEL